MTNGFDLIYIQRIFSQCEFIPLGSTFLDCTYWRFYGMQDWIPNRRTNFKRNFHVNINRQTIDTYFYDSSGILRRRRIYQGQRSLLNLMLSNVHRFSAPSLGRHVLNSSAGLTFDCMFCRAALLNHFYGGDDVLFNRRRAARQHTVWPLLINVLSNDDDDEVPPLLW